jgi:hypothetical protein
MIDPLKDTTALIAQVRAGFVPQAEAVGAFGYDFRAAVKMIREANALLDKAGLALDATRGGGEVRRGAGSGAAGGHRDRGDRCRGTAAGDPSTGLTMTEPIEPGGSDAALEPAAVPVTAQRAIAAPAIAIEPVLPDEEPAMSETTLAAPAAAPAAPPAAAEEVRASRRRAVRKAGAATFAPAQTPPTKRATAASMAGPGSLGVGRW